MNPKERYHSFSCLFTPSREKSKEVDEYRKVCHCCNELTTHIEYANCPKCGEELSPQVKLTGTNCGECGNPQFMTPHGVCCAEGHGGAEALLALSDEERKKSPADRIHKHLYQEGRLHPPGQAQAGGGLRQTLRGPPERGEEDRPQGGGRDIPEHAYLSHPRKGAGMKTLVDKILLHFETSNPSALPQAVRETMIRDVLEAMKKAGLIMMEEK